MLRSIEDAPSPRLSDPPLGVAERLRVAGQLLLNLRRHDRRAALTFFRRAYSHGSWASRAAAFLRWAGHQWWCAIPWGMRGATFQEPVSTTPIWLEDENPLAGHPWRRTPDQALPDRAEVVVIGAGFTGASLAYHWARSGTTKSMVVLDMGDPASGASGRNAGEVVMGRYFALVFSTVRKHLPLARPDLAAPAMDQLARQFAATYCRAAYRNADLIERTIREEGFACDYAREGWVQERPAEEQGALETTVRLGRENGFDDWDRLDGTEASRKTGARIPLPANYSRRAARFHPAKWVWSLLRRALQSDSVELFTNTRVLSVRDEGDEYRVNTARGAILAKHVVNATEAYSANLHQSFAGIINPRQSQAAYGLDGGLSLKPHLPFSGSTFFCVRHRDGILFGTDESPIPGRRVGRNQASRFLSMFVVAQLRQRFGGFPLRVTNEWAGSVGFTPDEYPVVGLTDGKRQYVVGGMSGSGTAISFNAGRCICGRILGQAQDDDYPPEYFSPQRLLDPAAHAWPQVDGDQIRTSSNDA